MQMKVSIISFHNVFKSILLSEIKKGKTHSNLNARGMEVEKAAISQQVGKIVGLHNVIQNVGSQINVDAGNEKSFQEKNYNKTKSNRKKFNNF